MPPRTPNKNSGNGGLSASKQAADSLLPSGKGRHINQGYAAVASVITKLRGCLEPFNGVTPDPDSCQKIILELMKDLAEASGDGEKAVPKPTIQASTVKTMVHASQLFGFQHSGKEIWELEDEDCAREIKHVEFDGYSGDWPAHLSLEMYYVPFWAQGSVEGLCRTPMDLFLFDRLAANQEAAAARRVTLQTGVMITADNATQDLVVSGECDYVLGYPHAEGSGETSLESSTVIIKAKTPGTLAGGLAQCACYLAGLQQQRKGELVRTVYGAVTDGRFWEFLRLDARANMIVSNQLDVRRGDSKEIHRFLDHIIQLAISASPHSIPSRTFPSTQRRCAVLNEKPRFKVPGLDEWLALPTKDLLASDDEYEDDEYEDDDFCH